MSSELMRSQDGPESLRPGRQSLVWSLRLRTPEARGLISQVTPGEEYRKDKPAGVPGVCCCCCPGWGVVCRKALRGTRAASVMDQSLDSAEVKGSWELQTFSGSSTPEVEN